MPNNQQKTEEKVIPEAGKCAFCGIATNGLYPHKEGGVEKKYCILCLEQNTDVFFSNGFVGYFGVTQNTRECFALLKLAILRALHSGNKEKTDKAELILKKLRESYSLVLSTYGSVKKNDLSHQCNLQSNLVLLDSDKSIISHLIKKTENELPPFDEWESEFNKIKNPITEPTAGEEYNESGR